MTTEATAPDYESFARQLLHGRILSDPWIDGRPRFSPETIVLSEREHRALTRAGEEIAFVYEEVAELVADDPALLDDFFGLTPHQKLMWETSRRLWHGIARADVFVTDEGLAIAELNSDTPTGEAEAVELGRIARASLPEGTVAHDPNENLEARFAQMVEVMAAHLVEGRAPRTAGLVYPTELSEDLSVVRLYRRWLERAGWTVVLGSPYNLGSDETGRATLFGEPLGVLVRHYKTDWWGERASAWIDEALADPAPLHEPLMAALRASVERRTAVINPFGAIIPQNKRAMALMWEHIHRFTQGAQTIIERLVPYTSRLETVHPEHVRADREGWVLKSDYGAEGDEVIIGRLVTQAEWEEAIRLGRPGRWIAQRYFRAKARPDGEHVNHGVFLVGGEAAGIYLRLQAGMTDVFAKSAPVLVVPESARSNSGENTPSTRTE